MIAHTLRQYALGGLQGIQSSQRDCSPFLVHFTNWKAMAKIRSTVDTVKGSRPVRSGQWVRRQFAVADAASFDVFKSIVTTERLEAKHPQQDEKVPECVCLTECNLPSLLSHAERYGRFGFVFTKDMIYKLGGRPCAYLAPEHRGLVLKAFNNAKDAEHPSASVWGRLLALSHVYRPRVAGGRTQDFTHEREWRLFRHLDLCSHPPCALLVPSAYLASVRALKTSVDQLVSIDDLFDWGA